MRAYELIAKKRDGGALSPEEIRYLIDGYTSGSIPDYQMAAFLMAVYFRGMTPEETTALTLAMVDSGDRLRLGEDGGPTVDKHSTGGVGDKTSLIVVPLVAECGLPVAKMSGRSLGHTGGTIDKLESIPGLRTDLTPGELSAQVRRVGAAIAGQSANMTPADKKLYALRDVTATVESIPLIAASIMSKKIATGADAFVLDVKAGRAAFMKTTEDAKRLARAMAAIAKGAGKRAVCWVTAMDQPLGRAVGNVLEVGEAVLTLKGDGPPDLVELSIALAAEMLCLGGIDDDFEQAKLRAGNCLASGGAFGRLKRMVEAQGGDPEFLDRLDTAGEPRGYHVVSVASPRSGWISGIDGEEIGLAAMSLGAGRETPDQSIDPYVGVVLCKKVGDAVRSGERLAQVIAADSERGRRAALRVESAYSVGPEPVQAPEILIARIEQA